MRPRVCIKGGRRYTIDYVRKATLGDITKKEGYEVFAYQVMNSFHGSSNSRMKKENMPNIYGFAVT